MRQKKPGPKPGSSRDPKWQSKERQIVEDFYRSLDADALLPGEHLYNPAQASAWLRSKYGSGPKDSDITEFFSVKNLASVPTDRKGNDTTRCSSNGECIVWKDPASSQPYDARVTSYENMTSGVVPWFTEREIVDWFEFTRTSAGKQRIKDRNSEGQFVKVNSGTHQ